MWNTISNLKYNIVKINKANNWIVDVSTFKDPKFMVSVNKLSSQSSLKGHYIDIVKLSSSRRQIYVYKYTNKLLYQYDRVGGKNQYVFNIPSHSSYITLDYEFVWENIPNLSNINIEMRIVKNNSILYRKIMYKYASTDLTVASGMTDYYVPLSQRDGTLSCVLVIEGNTPSVHMNPVIRFGYDKEVVEKVEDYEATVMILEG